MPFSELLPLVGRDAEWALLGELLERVRGGNGGTVLLVGEAGTGKTRLAHELAGRAERDGWRTARGSAYPAERGIPYAPVADALLPLLRALGPAELTLLTRGRERDLEFFFPGALPLPGGAEPVGEGDATELKTRMLWSFAQLLGRLARQRPLLILMDNLQWADPSSLEFVHFLARQIAAEPILLVATVNSTETRPGTPADEAVRSLVATGAARLCPLGPLPVEAIGQMARAVLGEADAGAAEAGERLHARTLGNPFFAEEILQSADRAALRAWLTGTGPSGAVKLPRSVREAVLTRVRRLSPRARSVAEVASILGTRASYDVLRAAGGLEEAELVEALEELCGHDVVREHSEGRQLAYDFRHPLLQDVVCSEVGGARARLLHAQIAEALERLYGSRAGEHTNELAFHFVRSRSPRHAAKAFHYLAAAGSGALAQHANREAADYLGAAWEPVREGVLSIPEPERRRLMQQLARARQRVGDYEEALALWGAAHLAAEAAGEPGEVARIRRRMGLACFWRGEYARALDHYEAGVEAARRASDEAVEARLRLARGACLQEIGRAEEARGEIEAALAVAERRGDAAMLARAHRALLLLHAWFPPFDRAREHGRRAVALAEQAGEAGVACSAHLTLGMLEALTGDRDAAARHIDASDRIAERIGSPVLRLWVSELRVEVASATGDWERGMEIAEPAIDQARRLGQHTLLPRLLVWAGMIDLGRGDIERARGRFDEAWRLSGAGGQGAADVHTAVPAHTGRAALHLARGEMEEARRIGEAGLAIADRSGYVLWAIHRLIPIIAEAYLWMADLEGAERLGERLRRDSERGGHRLGMAWADACDGVVAQLRGDGARAAEMLRRGVERLESLPLVFDGARLRRQLALVLADRGDMAGAVTALRPAYETFARLGAEPELEAARAQLRALGVRLPTRGGAAGAAGLTARETEIVQLAAEGRSNKAIARALDISPRTVSTHVANLYRKLGVASRMQLADFARRTGITTSE